MKILDIYVRLLASLTIKRYIAKGYFTLTVNSNVDINESVLLLSILQIFEKNKETWPENTYPG